jgi:hypothetical protein
MPENPDAACGAADLGQRFQTSPTIRQGSLAGTYGDYIVPGRALPLYPSCTAARATT